MANSEVLQKLKSNFEPVANEAICNNMKNSEVFEKVKAIFETVAKEVTCNFCQVIIWNSPVFESTEGITVCETCKNSSQENFNRNFKLERALLAFETKCKYEIDGCKNSSGPHNIILHEENCQFRFVHCPILSTCKEKFQFRKLFEHINYMHVFFEDVRHESEFCGSFSITPQKLIGARLRSKAFTCVWGNLLGMVSHKMSITIFGHKHSKI